MRYAVIDLNAINAANFNDVGVVTATANASIVVTGDANTQFAGFANAVNLQAGALTGVLVATGSGVDDILVGGTNKNSLSGGLGFDSIDISKTSTVAGDVVGLQGVLLSANRDTVSGFQAGASGDLVRIAAADTTAPTAIATTIAFQEVNSNTGAYNFLTAANDLLELNFALAGTSLAGNGGTSLDGTNLLAAVGTITLAADTHTGYLVAYQDGNAYLYHVADSGDVGATIQNTEVNLVGVFNGVAVGAFAQSNFVLV